MFFILRAAFWLSLVVLLLPADESADGQVAQVSTGEAITVAQTFVSDVTGFCARNPQACETGQSVLRTFGSKAQYGAKLVYGYLGEVTGRRWRGRAAQCSHHERAHRAHRHHPPGNLLAADSPDRPGPQRRGHPYRLDRL